MLQLTRTMHWGFATHKGFRPANEDALYVPPTGTYGISPIRLFAVADGMGGQQGGGLASRIACDGMDRYFQDRTNGHQPKTRWDFRRQLEEAVLRVDRDIRRHGKSEASLADMGTTLSCLVVTARHTIVAHVGDSRIYRLRRGHLTCLTVDHTFVQDMILEGEIDPAQAAGHPLRHLLTNVVGTVEPLEWVDTRIDPLGKGDRFLLCTDGLHSSLEPERIAKELKQGGTARHVAVGLVHQAVKAGAKDNITAVVVKND